MCAIDQCVGECLPSSPLYTFLFFLSLPPPSPLSLPLLPPLLSPFPPPPSLSHSLSFSLSSPSLFSPPSPPLPSQMAPMVTTVGTLDPPLGNTRLQVVKLFSSLLHCNESRISAEIARLKTFSVLMVRVHPLLHYVSHLSALPLLPHSFPLFLPSYFIPLLPTLSSSSLLSILLSLFLLPSLLSYLLSPFSLPLPLPPPLPTVSVSTFLFHTNIFRSLVVQDAVSITIYRIAGNFRWSKFSLTTPLYHHQANGGQKISREKG